MAFKTYIDKKAQEGLKITCAWCGTTVVEKDTEAERPAICIDCFQEELLQDVEKTTCSALSTDRFEMRIPMLKPNVCYQCR